MDDLIAFPNRTDLPILAQAAIAHAKFESIHPLIDGNGRLGRAPISAILRRRGLTRRTSVPLASVMLADTSKYLACYRGRSGIRVRWVPSTAPPSSRDRPRKTPHVRSPNYPTTGAADCQAARTPPTRRCSTPRSSKRTPCNRSPAPPTSTSTGPQPAHRRGILEILSERPTQPHLGRHRRPRRTRRPQRRYRQTHHRPLVIPNPRTEEKSTMGALLPALQFNHLHEGHAGELATYTWAGGRQSALNERIHQVPQASVPDAGQHWHRIRQDG